MGFLRKIFKSAYKIISFNIIISTIVITAIVSVNQYFTLKDFSKEHNNLANKIHTLFITKKINDIQYITDNDIFIVSNEKFYTLKNRQFVEINNPIEASNFTIDIIEDIFIELPSFVVYEYPDGTTIKINASHTTYFSIILYLLLITLMVLINFLFLSAMRSNISKMNNLKISAQEYALSERTTSYLVSIMHHKLNTPLKVLATKSRVLIETIVNSNIDESIKEKSEWNYVQIDRSLKTIFNVTNKLKSYNELSQSEVNLYKLFTISKETIDILKDDEFEIDIDYKAKMFEIDKRMLSSHETIQIFINQIKFSLAQLADKISIRVFNSDDTSITILYSDNGNTIDSTLNELIEKQITIAELNEMNIETDYFDLILNFNIMNSNDFSNIRVLTSNENGNVFEIKLPTFKKKIKKR